MHSVWSQDTDALVTETRINWTRWKRVLNFKPLRCTSIVLSSNPLHKVIIDIVFSLNIKDVRLGFSASRIALNYSAGMAFNQIFFAKVCFGLSTLYLFDREN